MPKYTENGLSLRWDEPDLNASPPLPGWVRLTIAVSPRHMSNVVHASYRLGGGPERFASGHRLAGLRAGAEDLFAIDIPPIPVGATIDYLPRLSCSNRSADPRRGGFAWAVSKPAEAARPSQAPQAVAQSTFGMRMDLLARVTVPLDRQPISVGETPDGLRIDFPLGESGTVDGPLLSGAILHSGEDWMLVRRDGIGLSQVRVLIRTSKGEIIMGDYGGVVDFGPDGYNDLISGSGPESATVQLVPRYTTSAPSMQWLNRRQCIGIGRVMMKSLVVEYDLYSVHSLATEPRSSA
jgi:hypothetical protein